ncbi:MAG TPA: sulfurtransferase TusA family protein [Candidatus Paenalcaligenes intestinipullorum]|uniref:Sulfurtransferase TusA family protein n=1 Tax=Candidatus Paenalcaligenes intestinipullorum TaxID=2838718 RepID=A0A9D2RH80_9BURK|nr:sulfurtransferase TusA family protein [Candidatus Paenalcaligenes intestinipullorum]
MSDSLNPNASPLDHESIQVALEVDASGLACPLPILRAKKALAQIESGQTIKVLTTDQHALTDFQAFAQQTGNRLLKQVQQGEVLVHYLCRR